MLIKKSLNRCWTCVRKSRWSAHDNALSLWNSQSTKGRHSHTGPQCFSHRLTTKSDPGIHGEIREHRLAFISRVSPTRWCNKHVCTGPSKMPNEPLPSSLSFSLFLLLWHLKKICPDDARRWLRASCGIASRETAAPPPLSRDDCMSRYCNISIYRSIISWRVRRSASDPQMKLCSRSFHFWPQIHETASTMMMIDRSCAAR